MSVSEGNLVGDLHSPFIGGQSLIYIISNQLEFVLQRLVLPRAVIDIDRNIPASDVPLIGTSTKVLVRGDLHPEIVQLLLQIMVEVHGMPNLRN